MTNLDGIYFNFRVKNIYCSRNYLDNIEGIKKFKFLNLLHLEENRLSNLDKFLKFLSRFAFLEYLNLSGNPLSEEPDYRLKVIKAIPSLKVLDKHIISVQERIKAEKLFIPNSPSAIKLKEKTVKVEKNTMSKGEKILYHTVRTIQKNKEYAEETVR